jgi:heme O synthase-like polyprenyltransferase
MTRTQIISGLLLLAIVAVVIATVGANPAVIVCLGVAVALYIASVTKIDAGTGRRG